MRKGLPVQLRPVVDAANEITDVDEVKVFAEGPVELGIVDLKRAVGWNPFRLDRGDVGADHFGFGILVCDVAAGEDFMLGPSPGSRWGDDCSGGGCLHGPDSTSGSHVENFLWVFDRGEMELVLHEHCEVGVRDIIPRDMAVVGREPVASVLCSTPKLTGTGRGDIPVLGGIRRLIRAAMEGAVLVYARRYRRRGLVETASA
jgi:hypothetical protein